jgi:hypothetical protein
MMQFFVSRIIPKQNGWRELVVVFAYNKETAQARLIIQFANVQFVVR